MLEKYLQEIGLSDKEAAVYLALLATDNASVVQLAEKTKIKRPTVYVVLESLAKKGLVSETTIGKKTNYQAEPPERLETYVERQKVVLDERSKRLKDIIPQIKSVQRQGGERPVVKFFEGKEGIISINEELYSEKPDDTPIYYLYSRELLREVFTDEERARFKEKRFAKNIKARVLYNSNMGEHPADNMGDRILVDRNKYPFDCDIAVYKDKVRISILKKGLSGIYISSKDFADTMRSLFNLAFDHIKNPRQ